MKEFTFDRDTVKSIRRVMGYTTDLRVKLDSSSQISDAVYEFIRTNAAGIFGCSEMAIAYSPADDEDRYLWKDRNISRLTNYVVTGRHD